MKLLVMMSYVHRPLVRQLFLIPGKEHGTGIQITWPLIQLLVTDHETSPFANWSLKFIAYQSLSSFPQGCIENKIRNMCSSITTNVLTFQICVSRGPVEQWGSLVVSWDILCFNSLKVLVAQCV